MAFDISQLSFDRIYKYIQSGAYSDVDVRIIKYSHDMSDLLCRAIDNGDIKLVNVFLNVFEVDINVFEGYALRVAVRNQNCILVELLLDKGANATLNNNEAIHLALHYNNLRLIELLRRRGAVPLHDYSLTTAIKFNHVEVVTIMLEANDGKHTYLDRNLAFISNSIDMVNLFLDQTNYQLCLHMIITLGHIDIFKFVCERFVLKQSEIDELLLTVSRYHYYETNKFLLQMGANVNFKNGIPLINSVSYGTQVNVEVVQLFLKHGADPSLSNSMSLTAVASKTNATEIIPLLIKHGANPSANNNAALKNAISHGLVNIVELLLEYGIIPTVADEAAAVKSVELFSAPTAQFWLQEIAPGLEMPVAAAKAILAKIREAMLKV
jgi:ankyrin repeat protein